MSSPLNEMIRAAVRCTKCGAQGIGTCACWTKHDCGWSYETSEGPASCHNPIHGESASVVRATHWKSAKP